MRVFKELRSELDAALARDPAARSRWELVLLYPSLHAVWAHRLAHRLWLWRLRFLPRLISSLTRNFTGVEIHPGARIGRRFFIDHGVGVVIGETAEIGDDVLLYQGVTLGGTSLDRGKRHPTLGNRVVVGAGAKILGPVRIGEGARIGASSVVIRDVGPGDVVVGIPARKVDRRADPGTHLRHDLIRDPLQQAVQGLEERLRFLESRLGEDERERRDCADFQI